MLRIVPLEAPPVAVIQVPGSKSLTNRALPLAALASPFGKSVITNALAAEDTEVMIEGLRALGFEIDHEPRLRRIEVRPNRSGRIIPARSVRIDARASGTTMRFLTALACLGDGRFVLDGTSRMRERPIEDLLAGLRALGASAFTEQGLGSPPVIVDASGLHGGRVRLPGGTSSQFLSALLMVSPLASGPVTLEVDPPVVSGPYLTMTTAMMRRFGAVLETDPSGHRFRIADQAGYTPAEITIEPDATAASSFFAAAAITGGKITIAGLDRASLQGDLRFIDVLEAMGCRISIERGGVTVEGGALRGVEADLSDLSDCMPALAVVACFAEGRTKITNVGHVRAKESDRIVAVARGVVSLGARVREHRHALEIIPAPLEGAVIETEDDHRIAMSFSVAGLRIPGVVIRNPECVAKSYPTFFDDLARLRHPGAP